MRILLFQLIIDAVSSLNVVIQLLLQLSIGKLGLLVLLLHGLLLKFVVILKVLKCLVLELHLEVLVAGSSRSGRVRRLLLLLDRVAFLEETEATRLL